MKSEIKILSGIAGEYFVAGELSRRGYIASVTLRNTAHTDVLASNGTKAVSIQIKTRCLEKADGWELGSKPLDFKETNNDIFYALVTVSADPSKKEISYYIIPKNELNKRVEKSFLIWKSTNKKNGESKISERRFFRVKEHPDFEIEKYKDNWDLLFIT